MQDGRKTSRSQEIHVTSFHEEPVSSERTERPVIETSVIQARSSEDSNDPNVEKAHERTRRLVFETNTENVPDSSQTRSVHESETFNVGDKTLRERTGRLRCLTPQKRVCFGWKGVRPWDHKRFGSHTYVPTSWMCKKQT